MSNKVKTVTAGMAHSQVVAPTLSPEGLEAAAREAHPLLFSDDEKTAWRAAEYRRVDLFRAEKLREMSLIITAYLTAQSETAETTFELHQDGEIVASVSGPDRDKCKAEINHYARLYEQDGLVEVVEPDTPPPSDEGLINSGPVPPYAPVVGGTPPGDDLVGRLRDAQNHFDAVCVHGVPASTLKVWGEAAGRIEALGAERDDARYCRDQQYEKLRLRSIALEELAEAAEVRAERYRVAFDELEQIYATDRVAQTQANRIETIFDELRAFSDSAKTPDSAESERAADD